MKRKLIDVSEHNGVIDWQKVKNAGIDGAIIRCGFGSDYDYQDDKQYRRNIAECERLNIPYGVYLYSYAENADMARSEAAHVLRLVKGHKLSYPVYYDLEEESLASVAKSNAIAFGDVIEKAGYWCGVYTWPRWFNSYLKGLERFTKWPCEWGVSQCSIPCDMWQYANNGRVSGINGLVDMDYCYRDFPKEINGSASAAKDKTATAKHKKKTTAQLVKEVLAGKWGNGETRRKKLTAAGYNYEKVQAAVDMEINRQREAEADKANAAAAKKYHTVKAGETMTGIAAKYKTTVAKLQKLNKLEDVNKIKAGQKLRVK